VVKLPPLRDRIDAVPLLVDHFLQKYNEQYNKDLKELTPSTYDALQGYHWPGNVRELENMVKRMVVLGNETAVLQEISARGKPEEVAPGEGERGLDLESLGVDFSDELDLKAISKRASQIAEKKVIEKVLQQTRWNRKEAAERLQISYKALLYKMKESGLTERRL
jgi:two-component system response regulator AtoC